MQHSLGKIVFLSLFLAISLFAKVSLEVPRSFVQGDYVKFKIVASGAQIEFPNISKIEDYPVQALGKSIQTNIINGKVSKQIMQSFTFKPEKDVMIPSFEIKIDGSIEKTEPKKLIMAKVSKTVSDLFDFSLQVDKTDLYVGEDMVLTVVFKYRKDLNIVDLEFQNPNFDGFWMKQLKDPKLNIQKDPKYHYQTLQFLLFPQKSGKIELGPFKIGVVTLSGGVSRSFFLNGSTDKQAVYSNSVSLDVKDLPNKVRLIGDLSLETSVDKLQVKQGEAISYKIKIKGDGNVDDIPEIKLDIPSATIYENPAKKEFSYKDGKYGGVYTKVFSIVPSHDFTLEPISLKYLDKKSSQVKTLKSKTYDIKVEDIPVKQVKLETSNEQGTPSKLVSKQETKEIDAPLNTYEKITYFLLGIGTIVGMILIWKLIQILRTKRIKEEEIPLYKQIHRAKTKNELLQIIAVYINIDKDLDRIIYQIETEQDPKLLQALKKEAIKFLKAKDIKGNI
jgi:hypothetical protein